MFIKSIILLLACTAICQAAVQADLVTGLEQQTKYNLPWYSGYLDISTKENNMQAHYFFFPSQSNQGKTNSDPVLLWLNGGPGCSSLLGASQENGPWIFDIDSTNIELNPFAWNQNANVIYIESPPGVGFSTTDKYDWNDEETAIANRDALIAFFNAYEEYRSAEFFISGESYAGIYIPTLSQALVDYNQQAVAAQKINFTGFIVGNGCTDPAECSLQSLVDPFMWLTFAAQGFFTPAQEQAYFQACGNPRQPDMQKLNSMGCFFTAQGQLSVVQPGVNIYNLIGTCYYQNFDNIQGQNTWFQHNMNKYYQQLHENADIAAEYGQETLEEIYERRVLASDDAPPCVDAIGPMTFFNELDVKKALHVDTSIRWTMCSNKVTYGYTRSKTGTYPLYPGLIASGLRVWNYSGDVDGAVPTSGTLYWIEKLNNEQNYKTVVPWRAWYTEGVQFGEQPGNRQNAGQFWQSEGITLVTFKGCGHMVPQDNRVGGLNLINNFMNNVVMPKD